jgi:hypothetical protein
MCCGANDGGVKRGDRADTGDLEVRHKDGVGPGGSGVRAGATSGNPTGDASALVEGAGAAHSSADRTGIEATGGIEDLTVFDASDPALGLTNIGGVPPTDWAADTGPEHSAEQMTGAMTASPASRRSTLKTHDTPRARRRKK